MHFYESSYEWQNLNKLECSLPVSISKNISLVSAGVMSFSGKGLCKSMDV